MTKLDIAIFDDSEQAILNLELAIQQHFHGMGYDPVIQSVLLNPPDESRAKEINDIFDRRPDVLFCDLNFGEAGLKTWGFHFISKQKPKSPDCVFILLSMDNLVGNEHFNSTPHPDIILSKTRFYNTFAKKENDGVFDKVYCDFFREEFRRAFKRTKIKTIDANEDVWSLFSQLKSKGKGKNVTPKKSEIHSMFEQVCFMGREGSENNLESISLEKIDGGLSGSVVCTLELTGSGRPFRVPAVVKVQPRESAILEVLNHNRYVKWMVPYTWRVDVLGLGQTQEFGAICYSFAHGGSEKPVSLTSILKKSVAEQSLNVIEAVFDPGRRTWYDQIRPAQGTLGVYLSTTLPYFKSPEDRITKADAFRRIVSEVCAANNVREIKINGSHIVEIGDRAIDLRSFEQRIFAAGWNMPVRECIGHGDMNSGNLMVKPNSSEFAFIDFRHTGWHHLSRDFCSLEGSVRTLFPRKPEVKGFVEYFEREIQRQQEESVIFAQKPDSNARQEEISEFQQLYAQSFINTGCERDLISVIRSLYHRNFTDSYFTEYALCVLAHTWWLTCFDKTWATSQREILVAQTLALLSTIMQDLPRG